jgi:hypothetical protein
LFPFPLAQLAVAVVFAVGVTTIEDAWVVGAVHDTQEPEYEAKRLKPELTVLPSDVNCTVNV